MKIFLDRGLSLNFIDEREFSVHDTLLHMVAEKENPKSLELLIERQATINAQNSHKFTPLMVAAQAGNTENIKVLLENNAEIFAVDQGGQTAKILAYRQAKQEAVRILEEAGANEYVGDKLPIVNSQIFNEKTQRDVSYNFHQDFSFVPKNFRIFLIHKPLRSDIRNSQGSEIFAGTLFAVLPSSEVILLHSIAALKKLQFKIADKADALEFVSVISSPFKAFGWGNVNVSFSDIPVESIPRAHSCLSIHPELFTFGIHKETVSVDSDKKYSIVRFAMRKKKSDPTSTPRIVKLSEKLSEVGDYSFELKDITTPGLTIRRTCFPR